MSSNNCSRRDFIRRRTAGFAGVAVAAIAPIEGGIEVESGSFAQFRYLVLSYTTEVERLPEEKLFKY